MKRLWLILCWLSMAMLMMAQTENSSQLQLHSFQESRSAAGMDNLGAKFIQNWPKDANGDQDCAWIRVTFENMINADAEKVTFKFANSAPIEKVENHLADEEHEIWLFVTPTSNTFMEARLDRYGVSNRLSSLKLEPKHVYDVVLKNNKTMSINILTRPAGLHVRMVDTGEEAVTPATFVGVGLGKHQISISENQVQLKFDEIEVAEDNVKFEYDLRKKKRITFKSDPSHAALFLNDEKIGETPLTIELPYDSYNILAQLGVNEMDSKSFTVSDHSESVILLEPIKKKTFSVYALYEGKPVAADLYVDDKMEDKGKLSYTLTKPLGKTYQMMMNYAGGSKRRKIKVSKNMNIEQEFKISARNEFVWPWQREYNVAPVGISVGYVQKQFITTGEGQKLKENGVWDNGKNHWLNGFQAGVHFQPAFSFGLGVYTGLFYEFYFSKYHEEVDTDYNEFQEHCLYVPLQGFLRIPFSRNVALSVHGGFGFNYSVSGAYKDSEDAIADYTDFYGEEKEEVPGDFYPKRFNVAAEIGVGFRVGPVQINAQYSKGLNDHKMHLSQGDMKTIQNKFSVGVSYMIGTDF